MEQAPKMCPKCRQANFPIAEFCRHCGEPIFEMGSLSKSSFCSRWLGHGVDGVFWFVDELVRWWEISKVGLTTRKLRQKRADILEKNPPVDGAPASSEAKEKLVNLSEELSRLASQEETLRRRSWAMTPEIILVAIVIVFVAGIFWLNPGTGQIQTPTTGTLTSFSGAIQQASEIPLAGQNVVTSASWYGGKLFIGGDGGLSFYDPVTGIASMVQGLPQDFFVRHLVNDNGKLLIAGYGGVFTYDATGLSTPYPLSNLPFNLINRLAPVKDGHLLGTTGNGLLKGKRDLAVFLLGTSGLTINGFAWLEGELWMLHERGLMRGDGSNFTPVQIPVLDGKKLQALAADASVLYVGSNEGLVAAYKTNQNWVWTPLTNSPRGITDLVTSSGTLLVGAEDGLYRLQNGVFEKLSSRRNQPIIAVGPDYLTTVGPSSAVLYRFASAGPVSPTTAIPIIPQVGTFSEGVAASAAAPLVNPNVPLPMVGTPAPGTVSPLPVVAPPTALIPAGQQPVQPVMVSAPTAVSVLGTLIPEALNSPAVNTLKWDGRRLWAGTSNAGVWMLENANWRNLSQSSRDLPDNQVVSLWLLQDKPFAFGWGFGLVALDSGKPVVVLSPDRCRGFIALGGDPNMPMALFDKGRVFRIRNGNPELAGQIDLNFQTTARGIHVLNGVPVVVFDAGVLVQQATGDWTLVWFPEKTEGKAFQSLVANNQLYIAKSDGSVFTFGSGKMQKMGTINEKVTGLAFDGALFVAGNRTIYQSNGGAFVALSQSAPAQIIGMQIIANRKTAVLATVSGMTSISLP